MDVLLIVGAIYAIAIQASALYLEVIIWIIELVLAAVNLVLSVVVMIVYCCS